MSWEAARQRSAPPRAPRPSASRAAPCPSRDRLDPFAGRNHVGGAAETLPRSRGGAAIATWPVGMGQKRREANVGFRTTPAVPQEADGQRVP